MRTTRAAAIALSLLAAAGAVLALTAATPGTKARDAQVERGRYLTQLGGCNDCHTPGTLFGSPDFDRQLSGSELGWMGPWGVTFARNLTPDVETGLGQWSEKDIVNALRTGMRPDGSVLQPPMPWQNMVTMTDADAFAIAAYLKSLKPVPHRVPSRIDPDVAYDGPAMRFPAPPAWDAPRSADADAGHPAVTAETAAQPKR